MLYRPFFCLHRTLNGQGHVGSLSSPSSGSKVLTICPQAPVHDCFLVLDPYVPCCGQLPKYPLSCMSHKGRWMGDVVGQMKFLSITCKFGERCHILHLPIDPGPFLTLVMNFLVRTYGPIILLPSTTLHTFIVSSVHSKSSTCTTFGCLQRRGHVLQLFAGTDGVEGPFKEWTMGGDRGFDYMRNGGDCCKKWWTLVIPTLTILGGPGMGRPVLVIGY